MPNGTTIVTQTLPTVVGMGVVSKTTETMFGKHGRKTTAPKGKGRKIKIYRGKRGGNYIIKKGKKIYI